MSDIPIPLVIWVALVTILLVIYMLWIIVATIRFREIERKLDC